MTLMSGVEVPPFPRTQAGDLARRLIPLTAALLAGLQTSRSEALLRPPEPARRRPGT